MYYSRLVVLPRNGLDHAVGRCTSSQVPWNLVETSDVAALSASVYDIACNKDHCVGANVNEAELGQLLQVVRRFFNSNTFYGTGLSVVPCIIRGGPMLVRSPFFCYVWLNSLQEYHKPAFRVPSEWFNI